MYMVMKHSLNVVCTVGLSTIKWYLASYRLHVSSEWPKILFWFNVEPLSLGCNKQCLLNLHS